MNPFRVPSLFKTEDRGRRTEVEFRVPSTEFFEFYQDWRQEAKIRGWDLVYRILLI